MTKNKHMKINIDTQSLKTHSAIIQSSKNEKAIIDNGS